MAGSAYAGGPDADPCLAQLTQQEFAFTSRVTPIFSTRFQGSWDGKLTSSLALHPGNSTLSAFGGAPVKLNPTSREWTRLYSFERALEIDGYILNAELRTQLTKGYDPQCWFEARPGDKTTDLGALTDAAFSEEAVRASADWYGAPTCAVSLDTKYAGFDDDELSKKTLLKKAKRIIRRGDYELADAASKPSHRFLISFNWKEDGHCDATLHEEHVFFIRENTTAADHKVSASSCPAALRHLKKFLKNCSRYSAE